MSEVISFRLDKDNPREAQARTVLKVWGDKGYGIRHVLTEALLNYQRSQAEVYNQELFEKLDIICDLLQKNSIPSTHIENEIILSDQFMASVKKAANPGLRLDIQDI
jgi:hypothetical protein